MKVSVDSLRCGGTGYCVRLAPEVFRLSAAGTAQVIVDRPGPALTEAVREAAAVCPTNAIAIDE